MVTMRKTNKNNHNSEPRVTMNIALSVSDKKKLKLAAMEKSVTVSRLIHDWIESGCNIVKIK